MKVKIVIDSSSSLSREQALKLGYEYLPLNLIVDSKEVFQDGVNIEKQKVISLINSGSSLKTSQSTIGEVLEKIENLCSNYDLVIGIPISSKLSGNYINWVSAKQMGNLDKFIVIDSKLISAQNVWLAEELTSFLNKRDSIREEEIHSFCDKMSNRLAAIACTSDFEMLVRGGRISAIKGFLGKLLKKKVIIKFSEGTLGYYDSASSDEEVVNKSFEYLCDTLKISDIKEIKSACFVSFFEDKNKEKFEILLKSFQSKIPNLKIKTMDLPNVIACHTGLNSYAFVIEKNPSL
jgi:DegV family protein with EDD domain